MAIAPSDCTEMESGLRSAKRRRLSPSTNTSTANASTEPSQYHIDDAQDSDGQQVGDTPSKAKRRRRQRHSKTNGISNGPGTEAYEDHDIVADAEPLTQSGPGQQGLEGDKTRVNRQHIGLNDELQSLSSHNRQARTRDQVDTARAVLTPSKSLRRDAVTPSVNMNGTTRGGLHNGSRMDDEGSPPPSLTPSRRNRVWPREYTNRGQREAELSQKASDPVVASPQSMLGRLASAGKAMASRFRLGAGGIEPVFEQSISTKDADPAQSKAKTPTKKRPTVVPPKKLRIEETEQGKIRNLVLEKLTGRRPIPLIGLDQEYQKVYQIAEQTVTAGEGNSMLIIGARGSGKSALMDKVIREVAREHMSDFHVIRLNGFIQTDDKLALREIWRQLGREMEVEDDETGKSYADTLARLLAILSHPSELAGEETESISKAVVFIMDEFDLFATHPRQTLLYNLFDIAQARKAPIAVFGLTTRIDVAESLEKRVKSRFSHRYVHLCQAPNLPGFKEVCRAALTLQAEELSFEEKVSLTSDPAAPQDEMTLAPKSISSLQIWNATINALLEEKTFLAKYITPHLYLSKSVPTVLSNLHLPIALAAPATLPLNPTHFDIATSSTTETIAVPQLVPPDSNLHLLSTLATLTLSLLIAAARCTIIHDTTILNFRIAYAEYMSLASKARIASASSGALATGNKVWGKEVAHGCWEELVKLGLLIPAQGSLDDGLDAEVGEKGMVRVDVALEEIVPSCPGMERGMEKWCKQI